jgi:outer membrane protein assembly factor BamB
MLKIAISFAASIMVLSEGVIAVQRAGTVGARPTLHWRAMTSPDGDYVLALAVGKDGTIYAGSWIGDKVQGFAPDGSPRRSLSVGRGAKALAIGNDGTIYAGTSDYAIDVFSPDGTPRSTIAVRKPTGSGASIEALAIGRESSLYAAAGNGLYGLDSNGTVRWQLTMQVPVDALSIGSDGLLYAGAGDTVHIFDPAGAPKKKFNVGARPGIVDAISIVAVYAGRRAALYVGSRDRIVYALDAEGGSIKWTFRPKGTPFAVTEGDDGAVYVGSYDGNVYALDPTSGQLRWRFSTGQGSWGQNPVHALTFGSRSILYAGVGESVEAINLRR